MTHLDRSSMSSLRHAGTLTIGVRGFVQMQALKDNFLTWPAGRLSLSRFCRVTFSTRLFHNVHTLGNTLLCPVLLQSAFPLCGILLCLFALFSTIARGAKLCLCLLALLYCVDRKKWFLTSFTHYTTPQSLSPSHLPQSFVMSMHIMT